MLIFINKSKLFTTEPAKRFAKEFNVSEDVWLKCWLKYKVLELSIPELCEYIHLKTGRKPSYNSINRWIVRTEIYSLSKEAVKMGATTVKSEFFGIYEDNVIAELTRNIKSSVNRSPRSIL